MRVFLVLCSLVGLALAKPQYNYGRVGGAGFGGFGGNSGFGGNNGFSSGGSSFGSGSVGGGSAYRSGSSFGGSSFGSGSSYGGGSSLGSGSSFGGSSFGGSSFGGSSFGGSSFGAGSSHHQGGAASHGGHIEAPLVHKQFITVSAPEDNDSLSQSKHLVIGRPQKNYRVVFIKAPSASSANVKLSAEYAPKEEKTVIYVLSKKDNALEVGDIATPAPTVPSKPEVFFIKYKTEAEAQHAQRQIQAEYDKIEGTSEHTDAGVAPQQSVVGALGNGGSAGGSSGSFASGGSSSSFGGNAGSAAYLPPGK